MLFYGVVSDSLQKAVERFATHEEAEAIVQAWDRDERNRSERYASRGCSSLGA